MSDAPEYIGVHFEEDHKMHGTWAGPAKGDVYVNILRHQKVIERAEAAEAKLEKAVEALDEAIYMLAPDERDMEKKAGIYRIVTAYEELKEETDE